MSCLVEGEGGNGEVSPFAVFDVLGDLSGVGVEANNPKEGGSGGEKGLPRAEDPNAGGGAA
jgi:hypothetical protein